MSTELSLLTFNIGNPSTGRAERQLAWLAGRDEHILVLTETKASAGCRLLADAFTAAGYIVVSPEPQPGEYGAMVVSKVEAHPDQFGDKLDYLPARAAAATVPTSAGCVRVIGMYVPSRDAGYEKTERKRKWLAACRNALAATRDHCHTILLGDLNILEPDHHPRYSFFAPFEYDFYTGLRRDHGLVDVFRHLHPGTVEHSWVGRTGDGYRYDHVFCSASLRDHIAWCGYLHQPRQEGLSDHSALAARLTITPTTVLVTSDPATAPAQGAPMLF